VSSKAVTLLRASAVAAATVVAAMVLAACDNNSSNNNNNGGAQVIASSGPNVVPLTVSPGPTNDNVNVVFTSVTVCVPGSTSNCQTIDGIAVDTGSSGLRILSSALTLSLPQENDSQGNPIVECNQFLDGFTWGPVQTADVQMSSERARGVPIQVIGAAAFPTVPTSCSNTGPEEDTLTALGANGLIGVGEFRQDCGSACAVTGASNPNFYFSCPSAGCQTVAVTLTQQVQNPVWMFSTDNNGVIVELPSPPAAGAATLSGSLVFGIGTQSNNGIGSAKIYTVDANGNFTTIYNNQRYSGSFLDTGSNGLFFLTSGITGMQVCRDASSFYCPTTQQNLSASNVGVNGTTATINFSVTSADTIFSQANVSAASSLAGPNPGVFDWGLPFFYGRNVFTAIESQSTPSGVGPYWAY
jgi:hypothetical protein